MARTLNNRIRDLKRQPAPSGAAVESEGPAPLTQSQMEAVEGIAMMLREIQATAKQINIQAAAFGLPLPRLNLTEAGLYTSRLYRAATDGMLAAAKNGGTLEMDKLRKSKDLKRLYSLVLTPETMERKTA